MLSGIFGVLAGIVIYFVGVFTGFAAGRKSTYKWLDEHGCYLCKERYEQQHPLG